MTTFYSALTALVILIFYLITYWILPLTFSWDDRSDYLKAVAIVHAVATLSAIFIGTILLLT